MRRRLDSPTLVAAGCLATAALSLAVVAPAPGYDAWPAELRGEYAEVLYTSTLRRETHVA